MCRFGQYDFTDVSPAFLGSAQEEEGRRLFEGVAAGAGIGERMRFMVLDVKRDVVGVGGSDEGGYEEGGYDVIVAANVLHATGEVRGSLANLRRLLKV